MVGKATARVDRETAGTWSTSPTSAPSTTIRKFNLGRSRIRRTLSAIADQLNTDGVPTAQGGRLWHPETVRRAIAVTSDIGSQTASEGRLREE